MVLPLDACAIIDDFRNLTTADVFAALISVRAIAAFSMKFLAASIMLVSCVDKYLWA